MNSGLHYVLKQLGFVVLILLLCLLFLAIGLMVGYSVFGDGEHATAILSPQKWQSIFVKFSGK